jgi:hypothetical protein
MSIPDKKVHGLFDDLLLLAEPYFPKGMHRIGPLIRDIFTPIPCLRPASRVTVQLKKPPPSGHELKSPSSISGKFSEIKVIERVYHNMKRSNQSLKRDSQKNYVIPGIDAMGLHYAFGLFL